LTLGGFGENVALFHESVPTEGDMAKGQVRSNKEKKKPKADKNKKRKGGPVPPQVNQGSAPGFGKKG
jgi:hypothetical protein